MLRKLYFIGLFLSVFSLFNSISLIAQASFSEYPLEDLTDDFALDQNIGLNDEREEWESEEFNSDLDDEDAAFLSQLLTEEDFLTAIPLSKNDTTYILYARPGGELGDQLQKFWKDVKAEDLKNPAVDDYPPHISLTGFFPDANNKKTRDRLIAALKNAISPTKGNIPIKIKGNSVEQNDDFNLDYIPFQFSPVLHAVAVDFLDRAGANSKYIKPKPGSKLGYHLTLREKTFGKATARIRKLENQDINLKAPKLQKNTTWALYIYKKTNGNLKKIYKQTINAQ